MLSADAESDDSADREPQAVNRHTPVKNIAAELLLFSYFSPFHSMFDVQTLLPRTLPQTKRACPHNDHNRPDPGHRQPKSHTSPI